MNIPRKLRGPISLATLLILLVVGLFVRTGSMSQAPATRLAKFPGLVLWAWERPEDLRFIDPQRVGVAFLAKTLRLQGDTVVVRPRLQSLAVPPGTTLMAVARIESARVVVVQASRLRPPALSPDQHARIVSEIAA